MKCLVCSAKVDYGRNTCDNCIYRSNCSVAGCSAPRLAGFKNPYCADHTCIHKPGGKDAMHSTCPKYGKCFCSACMVGIRDIVLGGLCADCFEKKRYKEECAAIRYAVTGVIHGSYKRDIKSNWSRWLTKYFMLALDCPALIIESLLAGPVSSERTHIKKFICQNPVCEICQYGGHSRWLRCAYNRVSRSGKKHRCKQMNTFGSSLCITHSSRDETSA